MKNTDKINKSFKCRQGIIANYFDSVEQDFAQRAISYEPEK